MGLSEICSFGYFISSSTVDFVVRVFVCCFCYFYCVFG